MRRLFIPLATLILLTAAWLRLWQLSSYPPGPHYDEAVYLIISRSIAFGGARYFPIVEAYQGREVLYMYLNAPLLHLLGDHIFTLRLSSAFFNLITVAAAIGLGRAMFRGQRGVIVGLAMGLMLALSFPQVWLGRQAFRAVTLPMMQALALLFLWRGLRGNWRWLALGGFFAGATLYTYMASRLFPFWLALGGLALLAADRRCWRARLRQGLVFFGVMIIAALPMLVYAAQRPDVFFRRFEEVTLPEQSVSLLESVRLHLRMFFIEGDPYLRYNIPGRPYLTWIEGLLLLVGIGAAARRLLAGRRFDASERAAYALALLSPLMVLPSIIAVGGLPPSHMRSLGMIPLICVLVATGVEVVFVGAARRLRLPPARTLAAAALITGLVGGLLVWRDYSTWASRADVYYETDADLDAAARWLIEQQAYGRLENTVVYVAAKDRFHPTMTVQPIPPVTWLGTDTLMRAPGGSEGLYLFPRSVPPPEDWRVWLEPGRLTDLPVGPDGRTAFEAFRLPGDTLLPESSATAGETVRNPYLTLVGLQAAPIVAGGFGSIVVNWRIDAPPPAADFTPIVELINQHGTQLYRVHQVFSGTDRWRPGEVLLDRIDIEVPLGTPPGDYTLRAAWVTRGSDQYALYLNAAGTQGGLWAEIGQVTVTRPASFPDASALLISTRHEVEFAPGVRLLGWDNLPSSVRPGETLPVTLYWQAAAAVGRRDAPALRALLRNDAGQETPLWAGEPTNGAHPVQLWVEGELLMDHLYWSIPRDQMGEIYVVVLQTENGEVSLGQVEISGIARQMLPPEAAHLTDLRLGDALHLRGYDLDLTADQLRLDLVWYASQPVRESYTVFVHLVDQNGLIIDQRDAMPQGNQYPTSLWMPGEYVTDSYIFPIFSQPISVRVGMYLPETGVRLPVFDAEGRLISDYVELKP